MQLVVILTLKVQEWHTEEGSYVISIFFSKCIWWMKNCWHQKNIKTMYWKFSIILDGLKSKTGNDVFSHRRTGCGETSRWTGQPQDEREEAGICRGSCLMQWQCLRGVRSTSEMMVTWCVAAAVGYVRGCSEDSNVRAQTELGVHQHVKTWSSHSHC